MKRKTLFKEIVPIYDMTVEVYLCEYKDLPDFIKGTDKNNDAGYCGFTVTASVINSSSKICIWVNNFKWTSDDMATLVHEFSHTVDHIAEYKRLKLDTESRAYLLSYLVNRFFHKIGRQYNLSKGKK